MSNAGNFIPPIAAAAVFHPADGENTPEENEGLTGGESTDSESTVESDIEATDDVSDKLEN